MISHLSFPFSLLLVLSLSALHSCTPYLPCHLRILQQHAAQTLRLAQQARPVSVLPPHREPHKAPPESLPCIICATRMTALRNHAAEGYRRGGVVKMNLSICRKVNIFILRTGVFFASLTNESTHTTTTSTTTTTARSTAARAHYLCLWASSLAQHNRTQVLKTQNKKKKKGVQLNSGRSDEPPATARARPTVPLGPQMMTAVQPGLPREAMSPSSLEFSPLLSFCLLKTLPLNSSF